MCKGVTQNKHNNHNHILRFLCRHSRSQTHSWVVICISVGTGIAHAPTMFMSLRADQSLSVFPTLLVSDSLGFIWVVLHRPAKSIPDVRTVLINNMELNFHNTAHSQTRLNQIEIQPLLISHSIRLIGISWAFVSTDDNKFLKIFTLAYWGHLLRTRYHTSISCWKSRHPQPYADELFQGY